MVGSQFILASVSTYYGTKGIILIPLYSQWRDWTSPEVSLGNILTLKLLFSFQSDITLDEVSQ